MRSGVDPVGRESNTIFEVAAAFQIEKHFLAGTPEIFDACAQFFRPGQAERHASGAKDDGFRRGVTRYTPQRGEGFGEGIAGCRPEEERERSGARVGERLLQIDLHRLPEGVAHRGPAFGRRANAPGVSGVARSDDRRIRASDMVEIDLEPHHPLRPGSVEQGDLAEHRQAAGDACPAGEDPVLPAEPAARNGETTGRHGLHVRAFCPPQIGGDVDDFAPGPQRRRQHPPARKRTGSVGVEHRHTQRQPPGRARHRAEVPG